MEKLTEKQYKSLVEAYTAVYDEDLKDKLNEEQQINEFLEVVNSLIEEGYDLSEYTYDELYESGIAKGLFQAGMKGLAKYGGKAWRAGKKVLGTAWQGTTKIDPKTGKSSFVPGAKQPAKEVIATVGKYSVPTGIAAGIDQYLTGGEVRRTVGKGILKAREIGHNLPNLGKVVDAAKPYIAEPPKMPSIPSTTKPNPPEQNQIQLPPGYKVVDGKVVREETIIKNHLLDNGYASTKKQAVAIMANMS